MDKACIQCWSTAIIKDSLINDQELFIESQDIVIQDLAEMIEKEKKKKKRAWIISGVAGTVFGALLVGLIK